MEIAKAEQISIRPLHCSENGIVCPMAILRSTVCETVAKAMLHAATREDPMYAPDGRLSVSKEATLLTGHMKLGKVAIAAGEILCAEQIATHNQTAAESLTSSILS